MQSSTECFVAGIKALRDNGWQKKEDRMRSLKILVTPPPMFPRFFKGNGCQAQNSRIYYPKNTDSEPKI